MTKGWAAICRFGGIGDNLIASAVLPGLKAKYGKVEVITQHPQHVVFENNPYIDKLAAYKPGDIPGTSSQEWQKWFEVRSREYDFFANLSHTCETMRALTMGQTQFYWSSDFRRKFCHQSYLETVADVCGVPYDTLSPEFFPTKEEESLVVQTGQKYGLIGKGPNIGWVLSGTRIDKLYPYAPMAVARLIREVGRVVLLGAPSPREIEMAKTIEAHVIQQNGSVDGLVIAMSPSFENETWPIRRILTMTRACDIVIGPDTGPMWSVAMCDIPKIMMLSHASPENITKYWKNTLTLHADPLKVDCWPCHRLIDLPEHCRVNASGNAAACISDITIETIIQETKRLLQQSTTQVESEHVNDSQRPAEENAGVSSGLNGSSKSRRRSRNQSPTLAEGRPSQPSD